MSATTPPMLSYLRAISLESPSCTLLTEDGGKVEVQAHLLSTLSPFLASLLAHIGPSFPFMSLPFSEKLVRGLFSSLVQNQPSGDESLEIATILGVPEGLKLKMQIANQGSQETKPAIKANKPERNQKLEIADDLRKIAINMQHSSVGTIKLELVDVAQSHENYPLIDGNYLSRERENTKAHKKVKKEKNGPHNCSLCGITKHDKYSLNKHMKSHTRRKPEPPRKKVRSLCSICSQWLSSRDQLRTHTRLLHGDKKHLPCSNCGLNFRASTVRRHEKLCKLSKEERAAMKIKCDRCGKTLANKEKFNRHTRFVHNYEKLFKCKHCDHKNYRDDNMKSHIKNRHQGEDPNKSYSSINGAKAREYSTSKIN